MTIPHLAAFEDAIEKWIEQGFDADCVRALIDARSIPRLTRLLDDARHSSTRERIIDGLAGDTSPQLVARLEASVANEMTHLETAAGLVIDERLAAVEALSLIPGRGSAALEAVVRRPELPRYLREVALVLLLEGQRGVDPARVRRTDDEDLARFLDPRRQPSADDRTTPTLDYASAAKRAASLPHFRFVGTRATLPSPLVRVAPEHFPDLPRELDPGDPAVFWFEPLRCAFVLVPGGGEIGDAERRDATPHSVDLAPYLLAQSTVTREAWARCVDEHAIDVPRCPWDLDAAKVIDPLLPVTHVTWDQTWRFVRALDLWLPTEAEWEVATRAGTSTPFWSGDELSSDDARFGQPWRGPVRADGNRDDGAGYPANPFGLVHAHGNVWEWCHDVYNGAFYRTRPALQPDPLCLRGSRGRVVRGGSFWGEARYCASACRGGDPPSSRLDDVGFRPARPLP